MLQRYGYDPILVDKRRQITKAGTSHWLHKVYIIFEALKEYDEILWTDWDVQQKKPLPFNFWNKLGAGPPLQSSLIVQRSPTKGAWWRMPNSCAYREIEWHPDGTTPISDEEKAIWAAKLMPSGGYLYIRGRDIIETIRKTHLEFPTWKGQPVMALVLDRWYGRWIGANRYKRLGHEPHGYFYGFQVFTPSETIWQCGERNWSWRVWQKGLPAGGIPRRL